MLESLIDESFLGSNACLRTSMLVLQKVPVSDTMHAQLVKEIGHLAGEERTPKPQRQSKDMQARRALKDLKDCG
ncbi:hypothetical protein TNCV_2270151 [Trichonephila clavipes]|nr:hypothetical protein TNCV_2270151 [Trichonephila clavipes]